MNWRQRAAAEARAAGIPVNVFLRQISAESGFNPSAHSPAGAVGIAQIMPFHATKKFHPGQNPAADLHWAAQYDAGLLRKYGSVQDMLSAYNSGRPWSQGQKIGETRGYVSKILNGAGPVGAGGNVGGRSPSPNPMQDPAQLRKLGAAYLLQQSNNILTGNTDDGSGLLGLAMARQALNSPPPSALVNRGGGRVVGTPNRQGGVQFIGDTRGENPGFLSKLSQAAAAVGGTKVRIRSGYRSPQHNKAVGGVSHSNHITGHAADGDVFIPGHGWVPLGVALQHAAPQFGLRSGNVPGFYHGGLDPVHVDDGFNQH